MLRKIAPPLAVLLSLLLDTAIVPAFYCGRFSLPFSLVVVILIAIQLGRMNGMLYGLIAGLLLDISTGTLGLKLAPYVLIGFVIGFMLDQQPEVSRNSDRLERFQLVAIRFIWIFVLILLYEIAMMVYQYFCTAVFEWMYVGDLLLRTFILTLLCILLYPLFRSIFIGRAYTATAGRSTREVKNY